MTFVMSLSVINDIGNGRRMTGTKWNGPIDFLDENEINLQTWLQHWKHEYE